MTKPSERIQEIAEEMAKTGQSFDPGIIYIKAISQHLDEEWEKENIAKCPYNHEKSPLPCNCGFK